MEKPKISWGVNMVWQRAFNAVCFVCGLFLYWQCVCVKKTANKSIQMITFYTGQEFSFHFHLSLTNCCTDSTKSALPCTLTEM